jgi:hypothetical protein
MANTNSNSIFAGTNPNQLLPNALVPAPDDNSALQKVFTASANPSGNGPIARTLNPVNDQTVLQRVDFGGQEPPSPMVPDRTAAQLSHVSLGMSPDEQHINALRAKRESLYDADARPYGFAGAAPSALHPNGLAPNHPGAWGHIAHVLSTAGQIAGDIVAPSIMAEIPGTQFNRMIQEHSDTNEINHERQLMSENQERDAGTQATQLANANEPQKAADTHAQSVAETGLANAQTQKALHPAPQNEFELWRQQNPGGTPEQYNQVMSKPLTDQDAAARNAVWDTIADKYHLPKGQFRAGMSGTDATALATALNNVVGKDQGGQKIIIQGQNAANAAGKTRDANTEKAYTAASKDLNSQFSAAQTQAETLATAREELHSGAVGQAAGTIKTLVGLAGGKGTGVRITQAELNAIAHARGIQGDFEGFINKLSGQGALSGPQLKQMDDLLSDVEGKIRQKMSVQDKYLDRLAQANSEQDIRGIQSEYRKEALSGAQSSEGSGAQTGGGGTVYARDPSGQLHQAPAGTKLPAGWKEGR